MVVQNWTCQEGMWHPPRYLRVLVSRKGWFNTLIKFVSYASILKYDFGREKLIYVSSPPLIMKYDSGDILVTLKALASINQPHYDFYQIYY